MLGIVGTGAFALAMTASAVSGDPVDGPPLGATITMVEYGGTACLGPQDTSISISDDDGAITASHSDYIVVAGTTSASLNCSYTVRINPPAGYRAAIANADIRGYSQLPEGSSAVLRVWYDVGAPNARKIDTRLESPSDDQWLLRSTIDDGDRVFSECGQPHQIVVHTQLEVEVGTADPASDPFVGIPSVDIGTASYAWQKC